MLSRRALVAGAGALVVAGCAVRAPHVELPGSSEPDPDVATATEAVTVIRAQIHAIRVTTRHHPALAGPLAGLLAMHRAHLVALERAVPRSSSPPPPRTGPAVPHSEARALVALRTAERPTQTTLAGLAQRARSGDFARLLASMAAAVAQQVDDWPRPSSDQGTTTRAPR